MISEHDADPAHLYRREREAFVALLRSLSDEQLRTAVPATPAWSVHDVAAHVVGITADLNAQEFGRGDPDAWTAAQVSSRRDRSVDELAAEWARESVQFEEGLRAFGYEMGSHFLGDLLQHAQDVRSALGLERLAEADALAVALDHYLDTFHLALVAVGVGSVDVRVADEAWTASMVDWYDLHDAVTRDEDYPESERIQRALASGRVPTTVLGRNEGAVQHVHRTVRAAVTGA